MMLPHKLLFLFVTLFSVAPTSASSDLVRGIIEKAFPRAAQNSLKFVPNFKIIAKPPKGCIPSAAVRKISELPPVSYCLNNLKENAQDMNLWTKLAHEQSGESKAQIFQQAEVFVGFARDSPESVDAMAKKYGYQSFPDFLDKYQKAVNDLTNEVSKNGFQPKARKMFWVGWVDSMLKEHSIKPANAVLSRSDERGDFSVHECTVQDLKSYDEEQRKSSKKHSAEYGARLDALKSKFQFIKAGDKRLAACQRIGSEKYALDPGPPETLVAFVDKLEAAFTNLKATAFTTEKADLLSPTYWIPLQCSGTQE